MVCNQYFRWICSLFLQLYLLVCWITSDIILTVRVLACTGQGLVGKSAEATRAENVITTRIPWKYRIIERMNSLDRRYFVTITWCVLTFNIMIVFIQMYSAIMEGNPLYPINEFYSNPLTPADKDKLFRLTRDFVNLMEKYNITYFMYGGTLLGSWRHHGLVPWDDDVDFLLNYAQRDEALKAMETVADRYSFDIRSADAPSCLPLSKFYFNDDEHSNIHLVWPFIDIFWYSENETHIWDCEPWFIHDSVYLKEDVFPLHRRPFNEHQLPAPCNTASFLSKFYDLDMCSAHHMSHIYHKYRPYYKIRTTKCERLYSYFPFVFRNETPLGVNETLRIGEYRVHSRLLPKTPCSGHAAKDTALLNS